MAQAVFGILLSLAAGAATAAGALIAVCFSPSKKAVAFALGFAGGAMAAVSLGDLLPQAIRSIAPLMEKRAAVCTVAAAMAGGMALALVLDRLFPQQTSQSGNLHRLGLFSMAALMLHNLPEGMAVFVGAQADRHLGASLALAIALHNLPEGLTVAMPVYAATKSRPRALLLAALSGAAEPVGAILSWYLLGGRISERLLAVLFSSIGGLMTCLAFGELLPQAALSHQKFAAMGTLFGVFVMILSLCLV